MRSLPAGRRLAVAVVALAVVIVAAITLVVVESRPSGPPWEGNQSGCRRLPMEHVHDPQRLQFLVRCSTVSGTVTDVHYVSAYDDLKITIAPSDGLAPYLDDANDGQVILDVIATDQVGVDVPRHGDDVTAWGAWVRDKATHTTMMLPVYRMTIGGQSDGAQVRGQSVEKHGPAPQRTLRLTARAPDRVVVGGRIDVFLHATWLQADGEEPASQVRLFAEMTTAGGGGVRWKAGEGVRWKAAMTDTRGIAVLHLVAIQLPGPYNLTVYSAPSGQDVTTIVPIKIARA